MGLSDSEFWSLTPWLFFKRVDAYKQKAEADHNEKVYFAWLGEIFARKKKLSGQTLKEFQISSNKKPSKNIDEAGIMTRLKKYKQEFSNGNSSEAVG